MLASASGFADTLKIISDRYPEMFYEEDKLGRTTQLNRII
jgi:hypothetical protein